MKIMALIVASFLSASAMGQGLQLGAGESYTYVFTSLDYLGPSTPGVLGGLDFGARFDGDLFDPGDSIRMEMFEGTLQEAPFAANTFTGASAPLDVLNLQASQFPSHWNDLQGAVRLTVLTGSANLARIGVSAELGPSSYGNFVAVPEPNGFVLCSFTGLLVLLWMKRKR